ncbi:MAG: TapB family protein, partial [Promethearchaeota archaeon]
EYSDDEKYNVKVSGKVLGNEFVTTKAGTFEAIKLETIVESSSETKNKVTEWITEGVGLLKAKIIIDGGGFMGFMRDLLGYGTIEFELEEIKNN